MISGVNVAAVMFRINRICSRRANLSSARIASNSGSVAETALWHKALIRSSRVGRSDTSTNMPHDGGCAYTRSSVVVLPVRLLPPRSNTSHSSVTSSISLRLSVSIAASAASSCQRCSWGSWRSMHTSRCDKFTPSVFRVSRKPDTGLMRERAILPGKFCDAIPRCDCNSAAEADTPENCRAINHLAHVLSYRLEMDCQVKSAREGRTQLQLVRNSD